MKERQTTASSSSKPPSTGQQAFSTGFANPMCTNLPRTSKHNPTFSALIGHVGLVEGGGFVLGSSLPPPKGGVRPPPLLPPEGGLPVSSGYVDYGNTCLQYISGD
uniref:Uncharacterized protein n=1 Tax=Nelumbo nucifera TaxID=4432 RepID=A0A822XT54_NELNU|nr:TPA_asm: hypothetical protein HUJ06_025043 [Nelumbo nucifera]